MKKPLKLTRERRQKYFRNYGQRCPFCESEDIESGKVEIGDYGRIDQLVKCKCCNREWADVYLLKDIEDRINNV
jgi:hypothetical protein